MSLEAESSNFVFWTSAASSLTLLSLYYVFNVAQVSPDFIISGQINISASSVD